MKLINNKIGLGTVQFGFDYGISNINGITKKEEIAKILKLAKLNGVETIDTAFLYGISQQRLGENDLSSFKVISKFSVKNANDLKHQLSKTLEDLNLKSLYGFLSHKYSDIIENPNLWNLLMQYKADGLISKIGFSFNKPSELEEIIELGIMPDLIQVPFNYLDNRFTEIAIELKSRGCEIHSRSTFLQGIFFKDIEGLPHFFNQIKPIIKDVQNSNNVSKSLISYVESKDFIDKIILGVETASQLAENLKKESSNKVLKPLNVDVPEEILMPMMWPRK